MSSQLDEEQVFHVARTMEDPEIRSTYLDQVCAGDQALRERVEALLQVHEHEQEFLKSNLEVAPTVDRPAPTEAVGQQIGRYKLLQQIGEGGFGVVYMAEQHRPVRRKVALKVIKPGMDTGAVVARFEAERQALAMMDHPNISRVLDGGATENGRPYFVMELVRGVAINEYCDKNQLSTKDRLQLFMTVCQAVQHAHQKGVIHRDIKPSNILVTLHDGQPVVKVIDFGVAKAINQQLTEKTLFTAYGQMVGTPQYISPEQAEMSGLDVDTRSDIYSLGVLLYELLTGATPLDADRLRSAGYAEMQRMIQEEEPPKPSTRLSSAGDKLTIIAKHRSASPDRLHKQLRGDLDWIAMKALDKDRNRRYETAAALSADIMDHLHDRPVSACPPSPSYRLRKFAKKHRTAVATGATVTSLVILSLIELSHLSINLADERDRANRESQRAADEATAAKQLVLQLSDTLFDQGLSNILSGQHELAEAKVERLLEVGAEDRATKLRVFLLVQAGDSSEALQIIHRELEGHPKSVAYHSLLAMAYDRMGDTRNSAVSNVLKELTPRTQEDYLFAALASVGNATDERLKRINKALEFGRSPLLLLLLGSVRTRRALIRGDVEPLEQAVKEVIAARELLGLENGLVRALCMQNSLFVSSTRRANGMEWEDALADAESVAIAIERSESPSLLERWYLGLYYCERGKHEEALFQFKRGDIETKSDYCIAYYLALASELDIEADPGFIDTLKERTDQQYVQAALGWYFAMQGRVSEALSTMVTPRTAWETSNQISLLYATGAIADAKARAAAALESPSGKSPSVHNMYYTAIVEDWDDVKFLEAADGFDETKWGLADAHYRLGIKHLGREDFAKARDHFQQCVDQRLVFSGIHIWSRGFVKRLRTMTEWPPDGGAVR